MSSTALVMDQAIQAWGNGLGMRITAPLAKAAHVACGTPIRIEVVEGGFFVRIVGQPKLPLAQKLKAFDPKIHGGDVMVSGLTGADAGCLLND